jgi:hypothetical protein
LLDKVRALAAGGYGVVAMLELAVQSFSRTVA